MCVRSRRSQSTSCSRASALDAAHRRRPARRARRRQRTASGRNPCRNPKEPGSLVVPALTTAEIDYLLGQRLGDPARRAFLADLAAGRFTVAGLERDDYATVADIDARYADLRLGLADCALIVLAHRYETTRLLTFDERHFRAVMPLGGGSFTLLPMDA
jgi:uncharacterized protein